MASFDEVNMFIDDKDVEQIVPIIQKNIVSNKEIGDYISQYIIYWWEERRE